MKREYLRWASPRLGRDMELLVLGHAGARVITFPTRCGRFHDYEDFGLAEAIRDRIERGHLQLYCLDSIDQETFYCCWSRPEDRVRRHDLYERYVLDEVLPLSESYNPGSFVVSHGCSLGAYHAVNIALRHPRRFGKAVAFSGRYDLTRAGGGFRDLLDGYFDDLVYYHMPNRYLPNAHAPEHLEAMRKLEIVLTVGADDPFLDSNRELAGSLGAHGMRHALHVWDGRAHDKRHWAPMAQLYL